MSEKYSIRKETIEQDNGEKVVYNVLSKNRIKRKQGKDLIPDKYYNIVEPAEIWFTDDEREDIIKAFRK